jgi:MFS superfamily sulfate permease-like transporter
VAGLLAAAAMMALLVFGTQLLAHIPTAALAGILFFVAQRIVRIPVLVNVWRQSLGEFLLIMTTMVAIVVLPIQTGVAIGIFLSLAHGIWTVAHALPIEFERIPETTIWWPASPKITGEKLDGVLVVAFQAPLSFVNADAFERGLLEKIDATPAVRLVVLEASSIVEIDFTAAQSLASVLRHCAKQGIDFAIARLESTRAQTAFDNFGLLDLLDEHRLFHSVHDAITTLAPTAGVRE